MGREGGGGDEDPESASSSSSMSREGESAGWQYSGVERWESSDDVSRASFADGK